MSPNGSDRSPRRPMRRKLLQAMTAGLVLATATGCTYKDFPRLGMPTPTTEEAPRILSLWQGSWAAALAVGVLVWGLIIWSAIFHRRSRTKVEVPPQTRYNMPIEALYTVVPLVIVSVLFYFTARDESKLLSLKKQPDVTINVVGYQWSWAFNYVAPVAGSTGDAKTDKNLDAIPTRFKDDFPANAGGVYDFGTPATRNPQTGNPGPTLWLPKGKTVRFVLTSRDVIHSFWVVPFLMKQDVIPGHTNAFEVTPNKEGTFLGKCAELCGVDHSRMLFNVKVVSPERYEQHLKDLAKKGQTGYVPAGIEQTAHEKDRETTNL
ncbi:cytochrome c oxidase subunit 2 [Streptomyces sp. SAI-208]|uniref:aa3-type cytochrome oxidase subunit II n=1 Tax=unclassified Streptomyces TaxID=2593676 RepID=UPI00247473B9|nr:MULTISPECIES: cytochrome c oxidase subunit II [unclassified Streptomyces]MDH6519613.1 cytochrome c oxidase subunit 2 [Streptomyces sp. SAI-090]MDH6551823.1 cytochrome c oxidase subunit 2 [Streptomyces sp. SAI-041]MDH6570913.1 cytochrome c oxidase subunit 2 [Streptomyces sp. SAI-117]MDH6584119.1 cytochrome c oxidase subunit 2 [Streptomyces sp. SAI-133]MDH6610589.1 cytochrome c oxidase subunit 2 [Streptomyces sp. SAI-208]